MDENGNAVRGGNLDAIEDDLHNLWQFVKLESRKVARLTLQKERIEQTLSEFQAEIRQRLEIIEAKDKQ